MKAGTRAIEGKTVVYLKDPVFGVEGWCLKGSLVVAMQTMSWVNACVGKPGKIGDELVCRDGEFVKEKERGE